MLKIKNLEEEKNVLDILKDNKNKNKIKEGINKLNEVSNIKNLEEEKNVLVNKNSLKSKKQILENKNRENINILNNKEYDNIKYDSCCNDSKFINGYFFIKITSYISYQQKYRTLLKYFEIWKKNQE